MTIFVIARLTFREAARRRILLAAHMDAIGLMVTGTSNGFLRVTEVGGLDARVLPGQAVTVHGREQMRGAIGFSAIRGGDIVGEHDVIFAGQGEFRPEKAADGARTIDAKLHASRPSWAARPIR